MMEIPHKNVTISDIGDGEKIITSLLRPDWVNIKRKVFDSGITNTLYGYIDEACHTKDEMILLRVYGNNTDVIIDRKRELETHFKLNKAGFASEVYCTAKNGYFYGYVDGNILTVDSVRDPIVAPLIAKVMAKMHATVPCGVAPVPCISTRLKTWLTLVPDSFTTEKFASLATVVESKALIAKEVEYILSKSSVLKGTRIVFCHNDLLLGNIIHNPSKQSIFFIDYEYGDMNYMGFDIGNHFNEYAGIENVNFELCPGEDYQKWWLKHYLEEYHKCKNLGDVTEQDITNLYNETNIFALLSHLWWAIWAIIQAMNSDIDFDFMDYSRIRLEEYFKQKKNINNFL